MRRLIDFVLAGTLAFLVFGVQPTDDSAVAAPTIQRALNAITTASFNPADPSASFPANYSTVMDYRPVVGIGPDGNPILMKASGDCSSFSGATNYRFDAVCKEHDLAYDVLRYSELVGQPLPATARIQADAMFDRQLHHQCTYSNLTGPDFPICHTIAESFARAVDLNSWRQGFRPPALHESSGRWIIVALATATLLLARRLLDHAGRTPNWRLNDLRFCETWLTSVPVRGSLVAEQAKVSPR